MALENADDSSRMDINNHQTQTQTFNEGDTLTTALQLCTNECKDVESATPNGNQSDANTENSLNHNHVGVENKLNQAMDSSSSDTFGLIDDSSTNETNLVSSPTDGELDDIVDFPKTGNNSEENNTTVNNGYIEATEEIYVHSNQSLKDRKDKNKNSDNGHSMTVTLECERSLGQVQSLTPFSKPNLYSSYDDTQNISSMSNSLLTNTTLDSRVNRINNLGQKVSTSESELVNQKSGYGSQPFFLILPNDSMHSIASFLLPCDLVSFSCTSKGAKTVCEPIFRTVRMHGFRCAVEVVSTWMRGEHADARELAALYVNSGIPIYPPCHGHAYHTLTWRMSIEAREMESWNSPENEKTSSSDKVQLDRFFADRYDARDLSGYYIPSITYLEEKCLFWRNRGDYNVDGRRPTQSIPIDNNYFPAPFFHSTRSHGSYGLNTFNIKEKGAFTRNPRTHLIKIHRHLANQHFSGNPSVEDDANGVPVGDISLSTNFFHPGKLEKYHNHISSVDNAQFQVEGENHRVHSNNDTILMHRGLSAMDQEPQASRHEIYPQEDPMFYPLPLQPPVLYSVPSSTNSPRISQILSDVTLEIYDNTSFLDPTAQTNIDFFHQKLEACVNSSSKDFSEYLADFWDNFFPLTKGILFFNKHTPVPRQSSMREFLTRPCPKTIGIVQCEIQRIRSPPKTRKDVKGRLFPTYEYRLFIRDRVTNETNPDQPPEKRMDTVIMTAKNKGRNHHQLSGGSMSSKRGVNNYFLYMGTKNDSELHNASIPGETPTESVEDNQECEDIELGRLQSNFIGTEFQIFSPAMMNSSSSSVFTVCESETETNRESMPSSKMTGSSFYERKIPIVKGENNDDDGNPSKSQKKNRKKSSKLGFLRRSRRAIAILEDTPPQVSVPERREDEHGSITYTANLLGNRPRIMDVCIPKICEDGSETEWHRYVRSCSGDGENNRMLNKFKLLQERLNSTESYEEDDPNIPSDFGLLALQNRPPWWNVELGAFVLNFGGRVSVASVKNFQLCDRNDQDHIMLQFGRIAGRHSFTMDFQHPLTAMQAFAIAISSLQSKISLG